MKISRILHAGYIFESDSTKIAFDPIFENPFSRNCYAFPPVEFDLLQIQQLQLNAIFISHFHDDHCSLESLRWLHRRTPIYMYCVHAEVFEWIRQLGFSSVHELKINKVVEIGPFRITPRRALDVDVDSIFQIETSSVRVLNVVDSWIDYQTLDLLKAQGRWDLILWPFQTMREVEVLTPHRYPEAEQTLPPEWLEQLNVLQPNSLVPSSCQFIHEPWSWYNHYFFPITYRSFAEQIKKALPNTFILRMDPGSSFEFINGEWKDSEKLPFVERKSLESVDYPYAVDKEIPPMELVCRNFPELSKEQRQELQKFLELGLSERFGDPRLPQSDFFSRRQTWQLDLLNSQGVRTSFFYFIKGSEIEFRGSSGHPSTASWITEASEYKLYSALYSGESLTSMYLRVNDKENFWNTMEDLAQADVFEDPLIRVLFYESVGSYQYHQLLRIQQQS